MRGLTVLYDEGCELCRGAREWLEGQPQAVRLTFVAAASAEMRQRFPWLDPADALRDLHVVSDEGEAWRGAEAWVMCLWALPGHRSLALSLASPALLPTARSAVAWLSRHRRTASRCDDGRCERP